MTLGTIVNSSKPSVQQSGTPTAQYALYGKGTPHLHSLGQRFSMPALLMLDSIGYF